MGPPAPTGQRGGGEEGEERLRAGGSRLGEGGARRDAETETLGNPGNTPPGDKGLERWRGGGAERRRETRPEPRKKREQVTGWQEREKEGIEAGGRGGDRNMRRQKRRGWGRRQTGEGPQVSGRRVWALAVPEAPKANPAMALGRNGFGCSKPVL